MPSRYYAFAIAVAVFVGSLILEFVFRAHWVTWPLIAISGFLSLVGIVDVTQTKQAIRRNYPILSHFRFFLRVHPAGNPAVFHRERQRVLAVFTRCPLAGLPASEEGI